MLNNMYENVKTLKESFYHKIIILFCVYLFSNYVFDRINHDELHGAFHKEPFITFKIPKDIAFKIIISLILILSSQWVYRNILKQYVFPKD